MSEVYSAIVCAKNSCDLVWLFVEICFQAWYIVSCVELSYSIYYS